MGAAADLFGPPGLPDGQQPGELAPAFVLDWVLYLAPDSLFLLGLILGVFATWIQSDGKYHATWGDRPDGRRLRTLYPMAQISPYIMVTRNSSTNFFYDALEISAAERYIRQKRREGMTNFGLTHVLLAAYVRTVAKYPGLNRFWQVRRCTPGGGHPVLHDRQEGDELRRPGLHLQAPPVPQGHGPGRVPEVQRRRGGDQGLPLDSDFDNTARALTLIPGVFLKFTVWLLRTMDYFGLLPGFLLEVSPFHGSVFFTSMGSLGIPAIYHHLYDFGNLPVFGAFGCKRRTNEVLADGTVVQRKYVDLKFCLDERIVDGFYYATVFKYMKRLMQHPDLLDQPPEEVVQDID